MRKLLFFMGAVTSLIIFIGGCESTSVRKVSDDPMAMYEREKRIGAEQAKKIEQQMGVLEDAALTGYLETVIQRLAAQLPRKDVTYQVRILDAPEPNAFAFPGGSIYVTRGLLALVNSEDELAGVISHEIGHVTARHRVQTIPRGGPFTSLDALMARLTGPAGAVLAHLAGDAGDFGNGYMLASYSREQEHEADRAGQLLAARAGWEPAGLFRFLTTLERGDVLRRGGQRRSNFLDSHPTAPERLKNAARYADELKPPDSKHAGPDDEFLRRLAGLVVGARAATGVLDGRTFRHPDLNFSVQFPETWTVARAGNQVTGVSPEGDAVMILKPVAEGADPMEGARALQQADGGQMFRNTRRFTIGNLQVVRVQTQAESREDKLWVEAAWIAHAGRIYQAAGIGPMPRRAALHFLFDTMIHTFRSLSQSERANVREKRIHLITAQAGESLETLLGRSNSSWSPEEAAIANGLERDENLPEGRIIKVPVAEPYASKVPQLGNLPTL